jgi:hypothetical protein
MYEESDKTQSGPEAFINYQLAFCDLLLTLTKIVFTNDEATTHVGYNEHTTIPTLLNYILQRSKMQLTF